MSKAKHQRKAPRQRKGRRCSTLPLKDALARLTVNIGDLPITSAELRLIETAFGAQLDMIRGGE